MNARRKLLVAIGAGVLTTPLASLGQQQSRVARIGYLAADSMTDNPNRVQAFRDGLHELGYVEGKNLVIEYRWAEGKFERLPALAGELVRTTSMKPSPQWSWPDLALSSCFPIRS